MRKEKGITLIALVITIIVLLILAVVTIATLTGDNGLLTKATNSKEKNEEAGICENIKLAYGEYQIAQHTGTGKTVEEIIEDSLKSIYGDSVTNVKVRNEKVTVNINVNNVSKTYIYKATTGEAFEYVDLFDYQGKAKKDLVPGDDISIGTENFRVFYNQEGLIKAMPWYNIELKLDNPKQSQRAGTSTFSSINYWTNGDDLIDMNDNRNNVQKYIMAYKSSIIKIGATEVEVRNPQYSELNKVTAINRNPGQTGMFWLNSSIKNDEKGLCYVYDDGGIFGANYDNGTLRRSSNYYS